jgi:hypothetical protein
MLLILKHRIWWKGEPQKWLEMIEARKARVYSQKLPAVSIGASQAVVNQERHG